MMVAFCLFIILIILVIVSAKSTPEMTYDSDSEAECRHKSAWWVAPFFLGLFLPAFGMVGYLTARESIRRSSTAV